MPWTDEDEVALSRSYEFTRADKGRREALRRLIKEKTGKDVEIGTTELQSQLARQQLVQKLESRRDQAAQSAQRAEEARRGGFGTKTIKELEEREVQTAQAQPDAEQLITGAKKEAEEQQQAVQEYQQQAG